MITPSDFKKMKKLRGKGLSYREIGEETGFKPGTVSSAFHRHSKGAVIGDCSGRGFGSMDEEKHRVIASMGGKAVPNERRSFSVNRQLASEAGRKGGKNVSPENRSFSRNTDLASAAGRKGGQASYGGKSRPSEVMDVALRTTADIQAG